MAPLEVGLVATAWGAGATGLGFEAGFFRVALDEEAAFLAAGLAFGFAAGFFAAGKAAEAGKSACSTQASRPEDVAQVPRPRAAALLATTRRQSVDARKETRAAGDRDRANLPRGAKCSRNASESKSASLSNVQEPIATPARTQGRTPALRPERDGGAARFPVGRPNIFARGIAPCESASQAKALPGLSKSKSSFHTMSCTAVRVYARSSWTVTGRPDLS